MTNQPPPDSAGIGSRLLQSMDVLQSLAAGVAGYRRQLIDGGFPEAVADQMAVQLHESLMAQMVATAAASGGLSKRKG